MNENKKIVFLFLLSILTIWSARSANTNYRHVNSDERSISITYHLDGYSVSVDDEGVRYIHDGFAVIDEVGRPALLRTVESFELPFGKSFKVTVLECEEDTLKCKFAPVIPPKIDGKLSSGSFDEKYDVPEIKPYKGVWPENNVTVDESQTYRDHKIGSLTVYPLSYNYEEGVLYICRKISLRIEFEDSQDMILKSSGVSHHVEAENLTNLLTIDNTLFNTGGIARAVKETYEAPGLLIVTPEEFKEEANRFASIKRRLGYNVDVSVQTKDFLQTPANTKSLIKSKYSQNYYLSFVLLFGGGQYIKPFKGKYVYDSYDYYTDHYFACLDGDDDVLADIWIGRFPANNITDAKTIVDKSIKYEMTIPATKSNYYTKCLNVAEFDGKSSIDQREFVQLSEEVKSGMESMQFIVDRVYYADPEATPLQWNKAYFSNVTQNIPEELRYPTFLWNGTQYDVKNKLEDGRHLVLFRGHGNVYTWGYMNFNTDRLNRTNNSETPSIVFAMTCQSGCFYHPTYRRSTPCLGEHFLNHQYGGAVAYIGATRESYEDYNDYMTIGMYEAMYPDGGFKYKNPSLNISHYSGSPYYWLGGILSQGGTTMFKAYGVSEGSTTKSYCRYNREIYNCLGDPSLKVHLTKPKQQTPILRKQYNVNYYSDPRELVKVDKTTGYTEIEYSNDNQYVIYDDDLNNYFYSFIGDGYLPYFVNSDTTQSPLSAIEQVKVLSDGYEVYYTSEDSDEVIGLYSVTGNKLYSIKGSQGVAKLPFANGFGIVTLEKSGAIVDSRHVAR